FTQVVAMKEFWQSCVQKLEQELPPQQISAWIRPLVPLDFDEDQAVLRVSAPNRFKMDWVRKNFSHQIEEMASDWFKRPVSVAFELGTGGSRSFAAPRAPAVSAPVNGTPAPAAAPAAQPAPVSPAAVAASDAAHDRSRLNTELTFENFVTGKANQLARAAALQVAENPGVSYNPLFLYGGVGLGKTHLIHA